MIDVKKIAEQAGINTCLWNYGSRSLVFTESCEGVARAEFEAFAALVLEEAAKRCDQRYWAEARAKDLHRGIACGRCAEAIRALKPKELE